MSTSRLSIRVGNLSSKQTAVSLVIIGIMFFAIGALSWANAILIPYFKNAFQLSHFNSYLVTFAFYISYLFISVPASWLLKKVGFKKGIMIALIIMAAGAYTFIPAAFMGTYGVFLAGLFLIGIGLSVLQTAVNPYVTILGPQKSAAKRISMMGMCNKVAGIIFPLLLASVIIRPVDSNLLHAIDAMGAQEKEVFLTSLLRRVVTPYAVIGSVLLFFGLFINFSPLPEIDTENESDEIQKANAGKNTIFQFPQLILGAIAILLHVSTQILSIDTIVNYAQSTGQTLSEAKSYPSVTLAATMIGYLIGIICIPKVFSQKTALKFCTILGFLLSFGIVFLHGEKTISLNLGFFSFEHTADISIWLLACLGFANSLIWAGIWPLALDGLGKFTKLGSSLMIMGLVGNALAPSLYSLIAKSSGLQEAYWILLPCFVYLIFYAFYGHRLRSWSGKLSGA